MKDKAKAAPFWAKSPAPSPGSPKPLRKGPVSKEEATLIKLYVQKESPGEIARMLNRPEETIVRWIQNNITTEAARKAAEAAARNGAPPIKEQAKESLRRSSRWRLLKDKFSQLELHYFEQQYAEFVEQFREDLLGSEESQVFLLIETDIFMNRNRATARTDLDELTKLAKELKALDPLAGLDDIQRERRREVKDEIRDIKAREPGLTKEYLAYREAHEKLLECLKATRAQRVTRDESVKDNIFSLLKRIESEADYRNEVGSRMEFEKVKASQEAERLSRPHVFENGIADQPFLTSETALAEEPDQPEPASPAGDVELPGLKS
jgi:hypothetical protein